MCHIQALVRDKPLGAPASLKLVDYDGKTVNEIGSWIRTTWESFHLLFMS